MPDAPAKPTRPTGPITVEAIVDAAVAATDLPPRGDQTLDQWAVAFSDPELARRIAALITAAAIADITGAKHWAHQAEDRYLRIQPGGKRPDHT